MTEIIEEEIRMKEQNFKNQEKTPLSKKTKNKTKTSHQKYQCSQKLMDDDFIYYIIIIV